MTEDLGLSEVMQLQKDVHRFCKKITSRVTMRLLALRYYIALSQQCESVDSESQNHRMVEARKSFGPIFLLTEGPLQPITKYCIQVASE